MTLGSKPRRRTLRNVAATLLLGFVAVACVDDGFSAGSAAQGFAPALAADAAPGDTIVFLASEFAFDTETLVAEPGVYKGVLVNDGAIEHDITFEGRDPIVAAPGETI